MEQHYETVIGLEVHVQLNTRSKVFCKDDTAFGRAANTQVGIISLAQPGTLPRVNEKVVESATKLGLALGCKIDQASFFDRKNYFYPDLPKGYQITQDNRPICIGGSVRLGERTIRIHHIHMEEDAGKSIHDQDPNFTFIDLNRAGVPLLEIVTQPDLRSAAETAAFMDEIRRLVRWIDVSDGNMEQGSMRCDVNISVRKMGETTFGQRCEIKNVNSMRFARKAIEYEAERQIKILETGGTIEQQTRGFDPATGTTYTQREKENAHDYRYFPEPDMPPIIISDEQLNRWQNELPELPHTAFERFSRDFQLTVYDAGQLTQDREVAEWFSTTVKGQPPTIAKGVANIVINKLLPWASEQEQSIVSCPVAPQIWVEMAQLIDSGKVSTSAAYQKLFPVLLETPTSSATELAKKLQLHQTADTDFLSNIIEEVIARFPDKVAEYQKGKKGLIGMFMGEIMKAAKGKADPKVTQQLLEERLKKA
jgi:aspartyl-tRNA(Asn)/glutamyl-tRNA(Gln) amidotransferase subunit B